MIQNDFQKIMDSISVDDFLDWCEPIFAEEFDTLSMLEIKELLNDDEIDKLEKIYLDKSISTHSMLLLKNARDLLWNAGIKPTYYVYYKQKRIEDLLQDHQKMGEMALAALINKGVKILSKPAENSSDGQR